LALFGGVFVFRWFARCFAYVDGRMGAAIGSDLTYSLVLIGSLATAAAFHGVSFALGSEILLASALAALLPFGLPFFRGQAAALRGGLRGYRAIFRDITRWSLTGMVFTELTINAHAYLVTLLSGPAAFALPVAGPQVEQLKPEAAQISIDVREQRLILVNRRELDLGFHA